MTQDVLEIRSLAREFAAAELRVHAERWDAQRTLDDDVPAKLAELGFFGMLVPESAGGMGFDLVTCVAALEELAWGEPAAALLVAESIAAADLIAQHANETLRTEWLGALASGDALGCVAVTAAEGAPVRAEQSGAGWRLHGSVPYVPCGDRAAVAIVVARDADTAALFAVPRDQGFRSGERAAMLGLRPISFVELEVAGDVPAHARLNLSLADDTLPLHAAGELAVAAIAVGTAQAALDHAVAYAAQREQFGKPIHTFEGIQMRLANMAAALHAARALVERAAAQPTAALRVAVAKLMAGEAAMQVTTDAVQVFGGYGYMKDYPVEKLMRDAKAMALLYGPSEVQRRRIAAALYAQ